MTLVRGEKVTVKLAREVWRQAKIAAAEDEVSIEAFVEGAVVIALKRRQTLKEARKT